MAIFAINEAALFDKKIKEHASSPIPPLHHCIQMVCYGILAANNCVNLITTLPYKTKKILSGHFSGTNNQTSDLTIYGSKGKVQQVVKPGGSYSFDIKGQAQLLAVRLIKGRPRGFRLKATSIDTAITYEKPSLTAGQFATFPVGRNVIVTGNLEGLNE